jgi:POT family proton-dependent oligopeptide transporter
MLFMSEFWERFAFYGIRWALVLYIVAQFHGGSPTGQSDANLTYGSYLALVYAWGIIGGYIADKIIGYQRSIPDRRRLHGGRAVHDFVARSGAVQIRPGHDHLRQRDVQADHLDPVGKLYAVGDERRDSGFTIFYMGINSGAFVALCSPGGWRSSVFGSNTTPAYKWVFIAAGIGMLISLVWFYIGRAQLKASARRRREPRDPGGVPRDAGYAGHDPGGVPCCSPWAARTCSTF